MNETEKAQAMFKALEQLEGEYRREGRSHTAERVREARAELATSPDSMARLFDILQSIPG